MFFKDFVSVKRQKIKRGASQTYDTPSTYLIYFARKRMIKDTQVAQFIATARLHLSLLPVIIDDSYLPLYKTLNMLKKDS